jgi:hypothetical protein
MTSKRTNRVVLPLNLKYWLSNYNHIQHKILPSIKPYSADELVVIPSGNAQIQAYEASGRLSPISIDESPARSKSTKTTKKAPSKKTMESSKEHPTSPATTTQASRQSDIKTYMIMAIMRSAYRP